MANNNSSMFTVYRTGVRSNIEKSSLCILLLFSCFKKANYQMDILFFITWDVHAFYH